MNFGLRSSSIVVFTLALTASFVNHVASAAPELVVGVVVTPGAPVALTHCSAGIGPVGIIASYNAINRSSVFLTSYVVRWFLYDHSGTGMGQADLSYSFRSDLAPNDTTTFSDGIYTNTEPLSALARVTCRMESAKFEGGMLWTYGRPWHGRLAPAPRSESSVNSDRPRAAATTSSNMQATNFANVGLSVTKAWNDIVQGNTFVHVAIDIHASSADTIVRPTDLQLTMKLASGEERDFVAMTASAPTYQKFNALAQNSNTQTAFEVDPKEDLGQLGLVKVAANSNAHVVATFAAGDASIANPMDNKRVVLK